MLKTEILKNFNPLTLKKSGKKTFFTNSFEWRLKNRTVFIDTIKIGKVFQPFKARPNDFWVVVIDSCIGEDMLIGTFKNRSEAITGVIKIYAENIPLHDGKICDCSKRWSGHRLYPGPRWQPFMNFLNQYIYIIH